MCHFLLRLIFLQCFAILRAVLIWFKENRLISMAFIRRQEMSRMKNMKLGKKLVISYAVLLILLVAGTAVSIISLVSLNRQIEIFYDGPFLVKGSANIINSNFERMQDAGYDGRHKQQFPRDWQNNQDN